jgi:parvulin-like peptidyl-prolyl isomerase
LDSLKILSEDVIQLLEENNLLSSLVEREIIKNKFDSININKEEIENLRLNFLAANKIKEEDFSNWLEENSLSEQKFIEKISFPIKEKKFLEENFSHKCHEHFLTRKDDLDQIMYSLIRTKEIFEAKELFLRVQDDESNFGKIASEYSQGPEKNTFGLIGPVPINKAHPTLREVLRSARPGETNQPFKIGDWWLIVRVETLQEAELNQEMEQRMNSELSEIWLKQQAQLIINNLKKKQNNIIK